MGSQMDLQAMIAEGLLLIQNDSQHDLAVSFRCRVFSALDETGGSTSRGQRTQLAALGVEKVLPLWDAHFPNDDTPRRAIKLANEVLTGRVSSAAAHAEMGAMWTLCDDLAWGHNNAQAIVMVGYGAVQVIREAVSAQHFGCENVNQQTTDREVDPYDHDSLFCAAIAYAGGPSWQKTSDAEKRREFWTWWLQEALPAVVRGSV